MHPPCLGLPLNQNENGGWIYYFAAIVSVPPRALAGLGSDQSRDWPKHHENGGWIYYFVAIVSFPRRALAGLGSGQSRDASRHHELEPKALAQASSKLWPKRARSSGSSELKALAQASSKLWLELHGLATRNFQFRSDRFRISSSICSSRRSRKI